MSEDKQSPLQDTDSAGASGAQSTRASAASFSGGQLNKIDSPAQLRRLPREALPALADELRGFVLESVSQNRRSPVE